MFDAIEERWLESPVVFDRIFGFDASWILALIEEGDANRALAKATKAHEYFSELLGESSAAAAESLGLMAIALDTTGRRINRPTPSSVPYRSLWTSCWNAR